ncbi:unnamed protein product [Urochloa humidicola]
MGSIKKRPDRIGPCLKRIGFLIVFGFSPRIGTRVRPVDNVEGSCVPLLRNAAPSHIHTANARTGRGRVGKATPPPPLPPPPPKLLSTAGGCCPYPSLLSKILARARLLSKILARAHLLSKISFGLCKIQATARSPPTSPASSRRCRSTPPPSPSLPLFLQERTVRIVVRMSRSVPRAGTLCVVVTAAGKCY